MTKLLDGPLDDRFFDGEFEEVETYLEFNDQDVLDFPTCQRRAAQVLEEFTLEEILDFNEIDDVETLATLFFNGDVGLPQDIYYDDEPNDEERQSVSAEEDETS